MKELISIQAELKAPKGQYNTFGKYKYRSCEDILEALKPLLLQYKCLLTISDNIKEVGSIVMVEATATITNTDGVSLSVAASAGIDVNRKGMDVSQTFGASSSYARKYALNGLFLIDDTKDADTLEPPIRKPILLPNTDLWQRGIEALKSGRTTSDEIREKYDISEEYLKKLMDESL